MADNFFSKATLKEYLKNDDKIIRIAKALERHGDEETLLGYLQGKISRSLAVLYNYWLERDGLPVIHSTAKNFFIFKGGTNSNLCTIDTLGPISATSIIFKMLEMIIKKRAETSIKAKRIK